MEFKILAKFLGTYMPTESVMINSCLIAKDETIDCIDEDRPSFPIRNKHGEKFNLSRGTRNYIVAPQRHQSLRTFESDYIITTEVRADTEHEALEIATERFLDVVDAFSIVARNTEVSIKDGIIKRSSEIYDFEIIALFVRHTDRYVRVKIPEPLVSTRNFFPVDFPENFRSRAEVILQNRDPIFVKCLVYFRRAHFMLRSGAFGHLEISLNYIKSIELIAKNLAKRDRLGLTRREFDQISTAVLMRIIGAELGVRADAVDRAVYCWDLRNKSDVAHQSLFYNPYNKNSSHALINLDAIQFAATEFITKYLNKIIGETW